MWDRWQILWREKKTAILLLKYSTIITHNTKNMIRNKLKPNKTYKMFNWSLSGDPSTANSKTSLKSPSMGEQKWIYKYIECCSLLVKYMFGSFTIHLLFTCIFSIWIPTATCTVSLITSCTKASLETVYGIFFFFYLNGLITSRNDNSSSRRKGKLGTKLSVRRKKLKHCIYIALVAQNNLQWIRQQCICLQVI